MVSELNIPLMPNSAHQDFGAGKSGARTSDMNEPALRKAAEAMESGFIAEMLKAAGVGKTPESFGGGPGEDAFASFLVTAQAEKIVQSGGFGLAEQIFNSLVNQGGKDE